MSAAVVPLAKPRCFNGTDASSTNTSYIITVIIIAIFTRFQSIFSIIVVSCENKRMVVISCESSIVQFKILISLDFVLLPFPGTTGGSGPKRPGTLCCTCGCRGQQQEQTGDVERTCIPVSVF